MQIRTLLNQAISELKQAGIESPRLEAELLMSYVTHFSKVQLFTHDTDEIGALESTVFQALLQKRKQGHPIAHLLGEREFWDLNLLVTPDTLIPRPDTEVLVEKALTLIDCQHLESVLDLGTGSGAIILALKHAREHLHAAAVDLSPNALQVAMLNAKRYCLPIHFYLGSWFEALATPVILDEQEQVVALPSQVSTQALEYIKERASRALKHKTVSIKTDTDQTESGKSDSLKGVLEKDLSENTLAESNYSDSSLSKINLSESIESNHSERNHSEKNHSEKGHLERCHVESSHLEKELGARKHSDTANSSHQYGENGLPKDLCFDMIVSNPPYIEEGDPHLSQGDVRFEPIMALTSGPDGLDDIRKIISQAVFYLNEGGYLLLEHGYNQGAAVRKLLQEAEFENIETIKDYGLNERVTLGRYYRHHGTKEL